MALFQNLNQDFKGYMNPFWIEPAKRDVMGYKLIGVDAGTVVPAGTPIKTDEAAKTAVICKYAVVEAKATDKKTLTVHDGHFVKAGEKYMISGTSTIVTIASVSGDDTIVLSAQNNDLKAGDILVEVKLVEAESGASSASGADEYVPVYPNRIVCAKAEIDELDKTCSAAHSGVVLANVVNYPEEYLNKTTFPGSVYLVGCAGLLFTIQ